MLPITVVHEFFATASRRIPALKTVANSTGSAVILQCRSTMKGRALQGSLQYGALDESMAE